MENNESEIINEIKIDVVKANRILAKLIKEEMNNFKTKQHSDGEMVKIIRKMIEEEVQCY